MSRGLPTPWTRPFGDPEALPILSARSPNVVRLADADAAADRWEFVMPEGTQAFELTALNSGGAAARIMYLAGPDLHSAVGGIVRPVPAGGTLIEFRHVQAGDILVIEDVDNAFEVFVHAHVGTPE